MWTRSELKRSAKEQMKGRYWSYLGASLMPQLASYVISIPMSVISQVAMLPGIFSTGMMSGNSELIDALNRMDQYGTFDPAVFHGFLFQDVRFFYDSFHDYLAGVPGDKHIHPPADFCRHEQMVHPFQRREEHLAFDVFQRI